MALNLGYFSRFFQVITDDVRYSSARKLVKFKDCLFAAQDVAFLYGNMVVVSDKIGRALHIYDEKGQHLDTLMKDVRARGIATSPSNMVAMVDSEADKNKYIKIFSSENGENHIFSQWGDTINWKPKGLAFSHKGRLVVTDVRYGNTGMYSLDGKQLHKFGIGGVEAQELKKPEYVAVDMFDRVLISDCDSNTVKVFDDRGTYIGNIGKYGTGKGQLLHPRGICSDSRGNTIVCDTGNKRVCVYSVDGRYIQDLLAPGDGLGFPFGIAYNKEMNQLAVTQHKLPRERGPVRKIRVYELDRLPSLQMCTLRGVKCSGDGTATSTRPHWSHDNPDRQQVPHSCAIQLA